MIQWIKLGRAFTIEVWSIWLFGGGCSVAVAFSYFVATYRIDQIVYAGTLLQLLGLSTVACGIRELRKSFHKPSLKDQFAAWIEKVQRALGKPVSGKPFETRAGFAMSGTASIVAQNARGNLSPEERIDALEKALADFRSDHDQSTREIRADLSRVQELVQIEEGNRQKGHEQLLKKLEDVAVGGVRLEIVGLLWLLLGTLGTCIPKVISGLMPSVFIL